MSFSSAAQAIRERLVANWNTTPIVFGNVRYKPDTAPWIRCEIINSDSYQASIGAPGANRWRCIGVIVIDIFTPDNTGDGLAHQYADSIAAIFRGERFADVVTEAPSPGNAQVDGKWYRLPLFIPFTHDFLA